VAVVRVVARLVAVALVAAAATSGCQRRRTCAALVEWCQSNKNTSLSLRHLAWLHNSQGNKKDETTAGGHTLEACGKKSSNFTKKDHSSRIHVLRCRDRGIRCYVVVRCMNK
jgi:hypothetical protein